MLDYKILLSIVNTGIALLLITLSVIMLKINKKKFIVSLIVSVIFGCLALYYLCLILLFYPRSVLREIVSPDKKAPVETPYIPTTNPEEATDFTVIITTQDNTFTLAPDGELEIKKDTKFKIEKVICPSSNHENIKADIKGFAGNVRKNDLQDIGYWVTYSDMLKHWAVKDKKDKFAVEIKDGEKLIGKVYIQFID